MTQTTDQTYNLDEDGMRLLRYLVSILPNVKPNKPETFVGYKEVHDSLRLSLQGATYGESLKTQGLNSLANWTAESDHPGITGLIIDKKKFTPGDGYFKLFGRKPDDFQWWESEIQKSKDFPWTQYLTEHKADTEIASGDSWELDELRDSAAAYLEMQALERAGTTFTKKKYYDELAAKYGRTTKAYEFRMQNISYVLTLMGRDWLTGLKPARNVGVRIATQIEQLIAEIEGKPLIPVVAFEMAVIEDLKKKELQLPSGSDAPKTTTTPVTQYDRDFAVKSWVLRQASGICECCGEEAPFLGTNGLPYLEVHHVRKLSEKGADKIENAVAICPNCHRELHYGERSKELVEKLYTKILRLKR